jgi:A/G-specific adenine glycosylase
MDLRRNWNAMKVREFRQHLLRWYRACRRPLPWREDPTPYRVWISEIMLQQTQAKTVIPYYNRFLERFPSIESLAGASEHEVLELWSGLGYYSRARNIHRAARIILEKHGEFPRDLAAILALPGIGRYTAGAVCSLAFHQAQPVVDGNVRRVIARLEGIRKSAPEKLFWDRMSAWIPEKQPSDFNQAMMELGALVCIPSHPLCSECPVERLCEARRLRIQNIIPAARAKRAVQKIEAVILMLENKRRLLLTSRHKFSVIPGEWGLPCRQILRGESSKDAADALSLKILGRAVPLMLCAKIGHSITNHRITAYGFFCRGDIRVPGLRKAKGFRWATLAECGRLLTSSLFHKTLVKYRTMNAEE